MEPLLRRLSIESMEYKPVHQHELPANTYVAYDDHGYADDTNITTGNLENLRTQIKKLHLLSNYT